MDPPSYGRGTKGEVWRFEEDIADLVKNNGKFESGEIGLPMTGSKLVLPCGIYGRWEEDNA